MKRDLLHKMYIQNPRQEDFIRLKDGMSFISGYNTGRVDGYNSCLDDLMDSFDGEENGLWFNIESAPKEGVFFVYVPSRKKHKVISAWMNSHKAFGSKEIVYYICDHTGKSIHNATHWHPMLSLPNP